VETAESGQAGREVIDRTPTRVRRLLALLSATLVAACLLMVFLPTTRDVEIWPGTTTSVGCGSAWSDGPDSAEVYSALKLWPCRSSNQQRRQIAAVLAVLGLVGGATAWAYSRRLDGRSSSAAHEPA
jgi:hypothetical protein